MLRYATPAGQGKTKTQQYEPGSYEPILSNRLAPVCSAMLAPDLLPFTDRGIRSLVSLPLLIADEPVAVFSLHAAEAGYFDETELKLLHQLAGDIAFAIDHIEKAEKLNYQIGRAHV